MGKYMGIFLIWFLIIAAVVLGIAAVAGGTAPCVSSWLLAILLGIICGALAFGKAVRSDID